MEVSDIRLIVVQVTFNFWPVKVLAELAETLVLAARKIPWSFNLLSLVIFHRPKAERCNIILLYFTGDFL
jgi:hypothetical protein